MIGIGQAFVGIVFVLIAGSMLARSVIMRRRQSSWQAVQGKVEAVDIRTTMNGPNDMNAPGGIATTTSSTFMIVDYSYRSLDGSTHHGRGRVQNLRIAMGGGEQTVALLVDPADPSRSMINGPSGPLVLVVVVAALFIAVGAGIAIFGIHLASTGSM